MKKSLRDPGFHLGTWLSLGSPVITEVAALCGFDWLLIDLEHGAVGESSLFPALQATRGTDVNIIVRVGAPHGDLIQRVLDWGADGIMVPHIDNADTAQAVVKKLRFPPHGTRGYSRSIRALNYGCKPLDDVEVKRQAQPIFMAQIESVAAVKQAEAIAAVDGVDTLFVGPADLNFDIKANNDTLTFNDALQMVATVAKKNGKQAGILNRDEADVETLHAQGYGVQAIDSDLAILRARYQELVKRFAREGE